ncbi:hypothetical protein ABMA27_006427 [Loxostege sticticalis]|uniref:Reverse transcriptase domain-containing protein n=1 Tax=Loxostege sticticalis TaxID=481309 RepID=A0ABR3IJ52_LOXSC
MRAQRNETRSPCEPISDRRCAASGARSVKLVTGHGGVGDQALHGNSTTGNSIKLRNLQTIGTWNVRGLNHPGKLTILEREIDRVGVNICGLSEIHWKGSGHLLTDHHVVYFSGNDISSSNGVGFLIPIHQNNCVMGYEPVSDRIISIKLKSSPMNLNIVQVYAPTSTASDEAIEKFYSELESTMAKVPSRELLIILGDLNSKIGENAHQLSKCAGRFGLGNLFEHHPRRLYTWVSPDGKTRNQIDYIMIRSRWRSSITNAHTLPGADCGSDHQLLISKLKLKLTAARVIKKTRKLEVKDVPRFRSIVERNWSQWSEADLANETTDALWDRAKSLIVSAVSEATPPIRTHKKQHWMTDDTFKLVEKRQKMKATGADIKDLNNISAKIQLKCRQDHNSYLRNICTEVEAHADRYESRDLYHKIRLITKTLPSKTWAIQDHNGQIVTELDKISEVWRDYCQSLFEDPQSQNFISTEPTSDMLEPGILKSEVRAAIRHLKNGKATGKDEIPIETIRAMGEYGIHIFHTICNRIWLTGKWPSEWAHTVFTPLHKKGSTKKCGNFRLIALITHASKIMLHIINERLKAYLSREIAPEQAGFVKVKGTREQILIVRQIIEKAREFNKQTYICFVDFSKTFDSVKWPTLSKLKGNQNLKGTSSRP